MPGSWIVNCFALLPDPFTVYLYTVSFSLLLFITVLTVMLHDYLLLIRTFAPFFPVRLYVSGRFHFLNFSISILKIAFSIFAFQLPAFREFSSPRFGSAKVTTFFYFANFIFFYFLKSVSRFPLLFSLPRLRAAKMWFFYLTVKCYFTCFSVYFIHH